MSRLMVILSALVLLAPRSFADTPPSERAYTPAEGVLDSEDAWTPVSLEKASIELRDLAPGSSRAIYQFHNTAGSAVTTECSYPVELDFTGRGDPFVDSVLSALGVPAGVSFGDEQYPAGVQDVEAGPLRKLVPFQVIQDGTEVPVTACQADFDRHGGSVRLRFRMQLAFAADQRSTVVVTDAMPTRSAIEPDPSAPGAPVCSTFTWRFLLETASRWNGPVTRIVLSLPVGFEQEMIAPWSYVGTARGQLFYSAEGVQPDASEDLALTWTRTDEDYVSFWRGDPPPVDPADLPAGESPARLLGASSYLAEVADVFLPFGVWRNAPFDPARLFDGLPETAWMVRTPRGGVGEYVRFSLHQPVCRVEVTNGWTRSTVDFPDKDTWSYFGKNNRVKTLLIVRDDGAPVARLALADSREIQRFNVSLDPGVYRAVIAGIYPGSRWNDTGLGELTFVPGRAQGLDVLASDAFFSPLLR